MITIDPDVFVYDEDLVGSLENFAVTGDFQPAMVVAALDGAADRLMLVDEEGVVHPDFDSMRAAGAISAASYVSEAEATDEGVVVYIDCQAAIEDSVAKEFKRILTDVLDDVVSHARLVAVRVHQE